MSQEAVAATSELNEAVGAGVTRRLALNACESCRQRKAKCDEDKPRCGRCVRLRVACHYKEPSMKKDPVLFHIRDSLASLEAKMDALPGLLQMNADSTLSSIHQPVQRLPVTGSTQSPHLAGSKLRSVQNTVVAHTSPEQANSPLPSTPLHHSTAPQNILLWPCLQESLPQLDSVYGLRGEIAQHNNRAARDLQLPLREHVMIQDELLRSLTVSHIKRLTEAFFDDLSIYSPLVLESEFADYILGPVLTGTSSSEIDLCIVLLVLFLGGKALADQDVPNIPNDPHSALGVFLDPNEANLRLSQLGLRVRYSAEISWRAAQALLLTGLFYSQRINVLDHFHAVQRACTVIMIMLQSNPRPNPEEIQIYWVAYTHESQLLAEFELPSSGIGRYADVIPFPFSEQRNVQEPRGLHQMTFLAHLALRKLLNRVHSNIYGHGSQNAYNDVFNGTPPFSLIASSSLSTGFSTSLSIIEELDQQLELWRQHLPTTLTFPTLAQMPLWQHEDLTRRRAATPHERAMGALRARYCSAKSIILRPFLYKLLNTPPQSSASHGDRDNARLCLLAVLNAVLRQGILRDSIRGIPMPLNLIRCFYAGAILLHLVNKRFDLHDLLPANWEVIHRIQERVGVDAAHLSPTIAEDMKILRQLDQMPPSHIA